jgi:hypothetical protein
MRKSLQQNEPYCTPNLFCIGGMRCGSTTLHELLGQHPQIKMARIKEPRFFESEVLKSRIDGSEESYLEYMNFINSGKFRTRHRYKTLFERENGKLFYGESSHYLYHPETADIIKAESPRAKIIISIRNPITRLLSNYNFDSRKPNFNKSFDNYVFNDGTRSNTHQYLGKSNPLAKGYIMIT